MTELLSTPAALREFLELPAGEGALSDDRANLLLRLISGLVLDYLNRDRLTVETGSGGPEPTVELADGTGTTVLLLRGEPVLDVVSVIEDPRGAAAELVDGTDFEWSAKGILRRLGGPCWARRARWYSVTYVPGYEEIPPAVELVVLRLCARAVVNPEGLTSEAEGGYSSGFAFDETRLPHLSRPDRLDLDPYRL